MLRREKRRGVEMAGDRVREARKTFYEEWVEREGLELFRGFFIDGLTNLPLRWWKRVGAWAAHIDLEGTGDLAGAHVCRIEEGKELKPQRHLYEELVFVLSGRGATSVWYDGWPKLTFEWEAGSLFAVPLNTWHQHFNGDPHAPVQFLSVNTAPIVLSMYRQEAFVFDNPCIFPERYDGRSDYFSRSTETGRNVLETNFVPNVYEVLLPTDGRRGPGGGAVLVELAGGIMGAHIMQVPSGTYTKLHRHGPGAHIIWLAGEGYTLTWPDGGDKKKVDWKAGTMLVPPSWWWHQHCVVSRAPAKNIALKISSTKRPLMRFHEGSVVSVREGGGQLEYEDLDPKTADEIHSLFLRECEKHGTPVVIHQPRSF